MSDNAAAAAAAVTIALRCCLLSLLNLLLVSLSCPSPLSPPPPPSWSTASLADLSPSGVLLLAVAASLASLVSVCVSVVLSSVDVATGGRLSGEHDALSDDARTIVSTVKDEVASVVVESVTTCTLALLLLVLLLFANRVGRCGALPPKASA